MAYRILNGTKGGHAGDHVHNIYHIVHEVIFLREDGADKVT